MQWGSHLRLITEVIIDSSNPAEKFWTYEHKASLSFYDSQKFGKIIEWTPDGIAITDRSNKTITLEENDAFLNIAKIGNIYYKDRIENILVESFNPDGPAEWIRDALDAVLDFQDNQGDDKIVTGLYHNLEEILEYQENEAKIFRRARLNGTVEHPTVMSYIDE